MTLVSAATAICQTSKEVYVSVSGRVDVIGVELQGYGVFFKPCLFLCYVWLGGTSVYV